MTLMVTFVTAPGKEKSIVYAPIRIEVMLITTKMRIELFFVFRLNRVIEHVPCGHHFMTRQTNNFDSFPVQVGRVRV